MKNLSTQLRIVLKNYHRLIDSLEPHEQNLLEENLRQIKRNMQTGTQRLPWTSTNHEKFITVTAEVHSLCKGEDALHVLGLLPSSSRNSIQRSIRSRRTRKTSTCSSKRFVSAIYSANHR